MTLEQFVLTAKIQTFLLVLLAILCFIKYRSRSVLILLVGFNFMAGFMANVSSWLLTRSGTFREFSNSIGVVYAAISIAIFSYLYWVLLFKKPIAVFITTSIVFAVFAFLNFFFVQKMAVNSNIYVLHAGIMICYTLWYFYVLIRDLPSLHVHKMPMFWFNSAFLILNAGTFFLFSFTSYLINVLRSDLITYWSFHNMLSIFAHLIVLVGLYHDFRQMKIGRKSSVPQQT